MTGRRERRRQQLLDDLKEAEDSGNWKRKYKIALCVKSLWKRLWTCRKSLCSHDDPVIENSISPEDENKFGFRNISEY
jgi:hypothetical protein